MFALAFVQQTRSHIGLTDGNPQRAAYAALMAGAFAGDIVAHAEGIAFVKSRRRGGHTTGQKLAVKATKHDVLITKLYRRWTASDELQEQYRSPVTYIATESGLPVRPIQRALTRLEEGTKLATVAQLTVWSRALIQACETSHPLHTATSSGSRPCALAPAIPTPPRSIAGNSRTSSRAASSSAPTWSAGMRTRSTPGSRRASGSTNGPAVAEPESARVEAHEPG